MFFSCLAYVSLAGINSSLFLVRKLKQNSGCHMEDNDNSSVQARKKEMVAKWLHCRLIWFCARTKSR